MNLMILRKTVLLLACLSVTCCSRHNIPHLNYAKINQSQYIGGIPANPRIVVRRNNDFYLDGNKLELMGKLPDNATLQKNEHKNIITPFILCFNKCTKLGDIKDLLHLLNVNRCSNVSFLVQDNHVYKILPLPILPIVSMKPFPDIFNPPKSENNFGYVYVYAILSKHGFCVKRETLDCQFHPSWVVYVPLSEEQESSKDLLSSSTNRLKFQSKVKAIDDLYRASPYIILSINDELTFQQLVDELLFLTKSYDNHFGIQFKYVYQREKDNPMYEYWDFATADMIISWKVAKLKSIKHVEQHYNNYCKTHHKEDNHLDGWDKWEVFKKIYESGDELWFFNSPNSYWENLAGRRGYMIIRNKKIEHILLTALN
jgi:hypothetical protein